MDKLTNADKHALSRMPKGEWFSWRHLPYIIRRPEWRCNRLMTKGILARRLNGVAVEYRIKILVI